MRRNQAFAQQQHGQRFFGRDSSRRHIRDDRSNRQSGQGSGLQGLGADHQAGDPFGMPAQSLT
jgi:hypothetical protein